MKPREIQQLLQECYTARKPKFILTGSPGCGKTSIIYQLFREKLNLPVYTFQATLYDPVEIKGLPVYIHENGGIAKFLKFEDMPSCEEGVLFIDDLPHAPSQTQNAFMRIILEGVAGAWNIGGLYPIAAGNKAMHKAGAKDLQTALANRFVFVEFSIDWEDWRRWAIQHDIVPEVISFISSPYGREWLDKFDAGHQINPTPRSWEFASDLWKVCGENIIREALYGCVGEEATSKFMGWLKIYSQLPDLNKIIGGENIFVDNLDVMYAVVSGLVNMSKNRQNKKVIYQRLIDYSVAFPDEFTELAVWMVRDIHILDTQIIQHCDFDKFQQRFGEVIL